MPDVTQRIRSGELILSWINETLIPWIKENRVKAGLGIRLERGAGGTLISAAASGQVTVDLRGVLSGPFSSADGQFVVVDVSAGTVTQQPVGTVRPSNPPENEVWIDLNETVGRVYIPRLG